MKPKISIITPSYNSAEFLSDCIESVLAQKYDRFEHIVVDGASKDGTLEILRRYPHLQWVSEPDHGEAEALNKALQKVTGDVVNWLNADDMYLPGALDAVASQVEGNAILYGRTEFMDKEGRFLAIHRPPPHLSISRMTHFWGTLLWQPSMFMTREAMEATGPFREDLHYSIDYEYWLRMARRYSFKYVDGTLSRSRIRAGAKSWGTLMNQVRSHREVVKPYLRDLTPSQRLGFWAGYHLHARPRWAVVEGFGRLGFQPPLRGTLLPWLIS